jgi:hypothetical protein
MQWRKGVGASSRKVNLVLREDVSMGDIMVTIKRTLVT